MRFATSPTQNTGMEMPISPRIIRSLSTSVPRQTPAMTPIAIDTTTQTTAAPRTSDKVTGTACRIDGMTFWPRLTKEVRSPVMKRRFINRRYCTQSG